MSATGRSVLVSGGSRGIGWATAQRFVERGDRVAALSRGGGAPAGAVSIVCDVRCSADIERAVAVAAAENGPVQVLVANAGATDDRLLLRMDEASFVDLLNTNLTSAYRLARAVVAPMMRARTGRLLFVSSVVALGGASGQANYAASKSGLIGLARSLAHELGPRGITSNVVAPGFIETAMTAGLSDVVREQHRREIPLRRFAAPDEVAEVLAFLASDAAGYVTGAIVPVDGGLGMGH